MVLTVNEATYKVTSFCLLGVTAAKETRNQDRITVPTLNDAHRSVRRHRLDATLALATAAHCTPLPGHYQSGKRGPKGQSVGGGACSALTSLTPTRKGCHPAV